MPSRTPALFVLPDSTMIRFEPEALDLLRDAGLGAGADADHGDHRR
jgi:hypothetical protein